MKAILLIDHGSRRSEANHMLACMTNLVRHVVDGRVIVHFAHMELAEPTIADGFASCVADGADEVVVFPYMLSPGKHATADIPRMVAEAAAAHPDVRFSVTQCFGVEHELAQVILRRAGVSTQATDTAAAADTARSPDTAPATESAQCWHPDGVPGVCGSVCALQGVAR